MILPSGGFAWEPFFQNGDEVCRFDIVVPSVAEHRADMHSAYRSNRFDAAVVDRRIGCITSARADAHRSDSVAVHVRKCGQVIDHRADVFRPDVRVLQLPRLDRAFTLV